MLVVVLNNALDYERAQIHRWYRVPMARAPSRIGAEYLAFYQTGAFAPDERWRINCYAPVRRFRVCARREIIPEEADHPRADSLYYVISLGPMIQLERPVVSRRLRRLTFLPTTLDRLLAASEINDLWLRSSSQERLWSAFVQAGLETEMNYPLREELPHYVVDFAFFCRRGRIGLTLLDECGEIEAVSEATEQARAYLGTAEEWTILSKTGAEIEERTSHVVAQLQQLIMAAGGISPNIPHHWQ